MIANDDLQWGEVCPRCAGRWSALRRMRMVNMRRRPLVHQDDVRRMRKGRPYRRARALILKASTVCHLCGHEDSDSVDHMLPLSLGGDPLDPGNMRPAHYSPCPTCGRRCNTSRGNGAARQAVRVSRAW